MDYLGQIDYKQGTMVSLMDSSRSWKKRSNLDLYEIIQARVEEDSNKIV